MSFSFPRIIKRIILLLFILILYFNNETLSNNLCTFVDQPCMYVAIIEILFFLFCCLHYRLSINVGILLVTLFMCLTIIIVGLSDYQISNGYWLTIMNILLAASFSALLSMKDFSYYYVRFIFILAVASLIITYPLSSVVRHLPLQHVYNSANLGFYNVGICYIVDNDSYVRNTGIFREAGVWGAFVFFALMLLYNNPRLVREKMFYPIIIVLTLTIISTFSTSCLIALVLFFVANAIQSRKNSSRNILLAVVFVGVFLLINRFSGGNDAIIGTINKIDSESSSFLIRADAIKTSIPLAIENPFGYGIVRGAEVLQQSSSVDVFHNTSTIVSTIIYYGFLFFVCYLIGLFSFCKRSLGNIWLVIPLLFLINAEQYIFNPIIYLFLFYGFRKDCIEPSLVAVNPVD